MIRSIFRGAENTAREVLNWLSPRKQVLPDDVLPLVVALSRIFSSPEYPLAAPSAETTQGLEMPQDVIVPSDPLGPPAPLYPSLEDRPERRYSEIGPSHDLSPWPLSPSPAVVPPLHGEEPQANPRRSGQKSPPKPPQVRRQSNVPLRRPPPASSKRDLTSLPVPLHSQSPSPVPPFVPPSRGKPGLGWFLPLPPLSPSLPPSPPRVTSPTRPPLPIPASANPRYVKGLARKVIRAMASEYGISEVKLLQEAQWNKDMGDQIQQRIRVEFWRR